MRIILKWILNIQDVRMSTGFIQLRKDTVQWWVLMNMVINLWVP
jgi:hypothetical protein